jgi:uncharacterized repeat protein (TIGR01451 family)
MRVHFILLLIATIIYSLHVKAQFNQEYPNVILSSSNDGPSIVTISDVDNDGLSDIICGASLSGHIGWYKNSGGGEFEPFDTIASYEEASFVDIETADIDSDGDLDIIFADDLWGDSRIAWFENLGDGNFSDELDLVGYAGLVEDLDLYDFNGDGHLDLLMILETQLKYYQNNGLGEMLVVEYIDAFMGTGNFGRTCDAADIDGDGDLDVLIGMQADGLDKVKIYENTGGTFDEIASKYVNNPKSIKSEDMDADGDQDIIVLSKGDEEVVWLENIGGSFTSASTLASKDSPIDLNVQDLDGDGDFDLVVTNTSSIGWFENLGDMAFTTENVVSPFLNGESSGKVADLDNDGDFDLVSISYLDDKIAWYQNEGDADFSSEIILSTSISGMVSLLYSDIDNDGRKDIVSASLYDGKIFWVRNLGDSNFGQQQLIDSLVFTSSIYVIDSDSDGDVDLISIETDSSIIGHYENMGDGSFMSKEIITNEVLYPTSVYCIDLDGDEDVDLITTSSYADEVAWFENDGEGSFGEKQIVSLSGNQPRSVVAFDKDNDGDNDIMVHSNYDNIAWYENLGPGLFSSENIIDADAYTSFYISIGDLDGDSDEDLIVSSFTIDKILWYENLGGTLFGEAQLVGEDIEGVTTFCVYDLDLDLDNDIITVYNEVGYPDRIIAFYNNGDGTFGEETNLIDNFEGAKLIQMGDIDQDGDDELLAASSFPSRKDLILFYDNNNLHPFQIRGELYIDANENGIRDADEVGADFSGITSDPENFYAVSEPNGKYYMNFDPDEPGLYQVLPNPIEYWTITSDSLSYLVEIVGELVYEDSLDFGFFPNTLVNKIDLNLVGDRARCDQIINYWIDYTNIGTTIPSGVISVTLDDAVEFVDAEVLPDSIIGQTVYWHFDSLYYFDSGLLNFNALMPNFESMGDTLVNYVNLKIDSVEVLLFETVDSIFQILTCGYDPNDKSVYPIGIDENGKIPPTQENLEFLVRFQNTGTDTAFTVRIEDQLDENLDLTSFQFLGASDPVIIEIGVDRLITFHFENILLPDSTTNEIGSHGFVKFKISLKEDLPIGTEINNSASIYFDTNPAVVTNITRNTLFVNDLKIIEEGSVQMINVFPNPFSDYTTVSFTKELTQNHTIIISNILGQVVYRNENVTGSQLEIKKEQLGVGVYILTVFNSNLEQIYTAKLVVK